MVLATARAVRDGPAAALPFAGTTLLGRLADQLRSLGVSTLHVITRPAFEPRIRPLLDDSCATIHLSEDVARDARAVAEIARATAGDVVIASADALTQREALAGLLADPRITSGILAGHPPLHPLFAFPARQERGRIIAAASAYHGVQRPNTQFLGVLRVASADRGALVATAEELERLLDGGAPAAWVRHLDVQETQWRRALQLAQRDAADGLRLRSGSADAPRRSAATLAEVADSELPELEPGTATEQPFRRAAASEDLASLLVVGLVRAGVHLRYSALRHLFWARPLSEQDLRRAREGIGDFDEDRALLDSAVKASDGFFTTFFVSPYSKFIARWCAHRGYTPNQVTCVSLAIGLLAAAAMATGEREGLVVGAVLLQLAFTTDCVDGQLARYTRTFSKLGAWLDSVFDRAKEYAVFAGLAVGASGAGDPVWALGGAAIALQTARHASDFAWGTTRQIGIETAPQPPLHETDEPVPVAPVRLSLPRRILGAWARLDRLPGIRWGKMMIAFPIGERFAVISVTAAVWSPRTTFIVLLVWGTAAAVYQHIGRLLRTVAG